MRGEEGNKSKKVEKQSEYRKRTMKEIKPGCREETSQGRKEMQKSNFQEPQKSNSKSSLLAKTRLLTISCIFESCWSSYISRETERTDIIFRKLLWQEIFNICQREMP